MKIKPILFTLFLLIMMMETAAAGQRLAVSAPIANIRSGPSSKNTILWKAEQNYPILIIEKKGPWYRFKDYENDEGWVHQSLVSSFAAVITRNKKNNIRVGPGKEFEIAFTVGDGIPFKVIAKKGNWIQIEHADGDKGWIHNSLVW